MQEDTAEADKKVAAAVDDLKALKASLAEVEAEMEKVTGIPRNKEAFREAVVRVSAHPTGLCARSRALALAGQGSGLKG